MKKILCLMLVLTLFSCKKKESKEEEPAPSTTGATPTPTLSVPTPTYAVQLSANNTDYNYSYASAKFYSEGNSAITIDWAKINGQQMSMGPGNEYRNAQTSAIYTAAVSWEISSSEAHIPDTAYLSKPFPGLGFVKDPNRVYDRTLDFSISVDVSACDSMFFTLGGVQKKIPGKTGISSIVFKPSDKVQYSITDSTRVQLSVTTYNYDLFTVRGKKWKCITTTNALSSYKYK